MNRILVISLLSLFLISCSSSEKRPLLSGLLWGGEGSRLVIKPYGINNNQIDTIIINHLGEFEWTRDSVQPGFYRLENTSGNGLTFFLSKGSSVYIDAQYINYPENSKIDGSEIANDILAIEKNTKQWMDEISQLSKQTEEPDWKPSISNRQKIRLKLDSIRHYYRDLAVQISNNPFVRYVALLQQAGNNPLFDPWDDRLFYLQADSMLHPYREYADFKLFSLKADSLLQLHLLNEKMTPGSQFPNISLPNIAGDTIKLSNFLGHPCYVEIWNPNMEENNALHASIVPILIKYRRNELQAYFIGIDSIPATWKEKIKLQSLHFHNVIDDTGLNSPIISQLGIIQLPANFVLNEEGIVIAKNIWGHNLENVLGLLLKK